MSNCLDIHNPTVRFTSSEINISGLKKLIDESIPGDKDNYEDPIKYLVAWFLRANTIICDEGKIHWVQIDFGRGDSMHTFRDFAGTINRVLRPLMKKSKVHTFVCEDLENPSRFRWTVDFFKGIER